MAEVPDDAIDVAGREPGVGDGPECGLERDAPGVVALEDLRLPGVVHADDGDLMQRMGGHREQGRQSVRTGGRPRPCASARAR